jgi:hypothetical protein
LSNLNLFFWSLLALSVSTSGAAAFELDSLLPANVPGYGTAQRVSILGRVDPEYEPLDFNYGTLSFSPSINGGAGYDSNPNGISNGSPIFNLNPSLIAQDSQLGFGGYIAGTFSTYPEVTDQNTSGYTVALGERILLPRETLTLAVASINTQVTGFGFNSISFAQPVTAAVKDIRGSDKITLGMLTLTPEFSVSHYAYQGYPSQDRTDYRQSITGEFASGGPARFVTLLQATQSQYQQNIFNANTYGALAGVADEATGLWQIRLLAGAASRQPAVGKAMTQPVLEASMSWMPTEIDSLSLDLAREIDDPDQESAEGYTLSEAEVSFAHEYLRNVVITGSGQVGRAVYFDSSLIETLFNVLISANWRLNRALSVDATYAFNDRQANELAAANENIITIGVTWTP